MKAVIAAAVVALLTGTVATAQDGTAAPVAGAVTLVQAGHLLDRPGQTPRGASTVVIRDGKVEAVQDGFVGAEAFPGAAIIDLRDRFVLPGLIDSHVHLTSDRAGQAGLLADFTDSLPARAYEAAGNARDTLMAGFTTVRNLGDSRGVTLALRDHGAARDRRSPHHRRRQRHLDHLGPHGRPPEPRRRRARDDGRAGERL